MTTFKTALFIAVRSIGKGNKSTVALIVFILTLSFFNLMFITGILSGLTGGMVRTAIETGVAHISILPEEEPTRKQYIPNQEQLRAQIETIPGVVGTAARYRLGATISHDPENNGRFKVVSAPIIGVEPEDERKIFTIHENIVDGEYLDDLGEDEILLAVGLAGGYGLPYDSDLGGVRSGEKVQVTYSNGVMRDYTVKGIFNVAGTAELSAFITRRDAESILGAYNEAAEIMIWTDLDQSTIDAYAARVQAMVPNLVVKKYTERLAVIESFLNAFDFIALIVSIISIAVAAVTIFVIIYVNAISKRRQIGILKAIGIKSDIIELSYVFQSLFYSLSGIIVGSVLVFLILHPILIAHPIPLGFGITISMMFTTVKVTAGIISLLAAGLLAGYIPARIVSREDILKAIWR